MWFILAHHECWFYVDGEHHCLISESVFVNNTNFILSGPIDRK